MPAILARGVTKVARVWSTTTTATSTAVKQAASPVTTPTTLTVVAANEAHVLRKESQVPEKEAGTPKRYCSVTAKQAETGEPKA